MSAEAYGGLGPADTLGLWVWIPPFEDGNEQQAVRWAEPVAASVVESRGLAATETVRIATFLGALALQDRPAEAAWRVVFLLDPDLGAAVWDIAFLEPDERLSDRDLVRADEDDQLGSDVTEFTWNDHAGLQAVRYGLADQPPPDAEPRATETAILAHASITLTRDLSHLGRTALLAFTTTSHLDSLAVSIVPMQYLLTSEHFSGLVDSTF